uniref:Uncharacterized protein n=1 Tax=Thermofilum pendens TaxID=2269 RepID=A0A7J3X8E6_THEPE
MTTARLRYQQKLLSRKHSVIGRVAALYLGAGLHVTLNHPTRHGPVHVVATGNDQRLAIDIYASPKPAGTAAVEAIARKAALLKAKPILALYGADIAPEALELARKLGVKVRRIRL